MLFHRSGPDEVPEHSDLIFRSYSASSIEELLSTGHSPPLEGSPHRSSPPFATPRAYRRGPRTASDDEVQRSGVSYAHRTNNAPSSLHTSDTPFIQIILFLSPLLSSPRITFSVTHENRMRDAATNNDWSSALTLSLFVLHVPSSSQHQRPA